MQKHVLQVTAALKNMEAVMAFIQEHAAQTGDSKIARQLVLVVEELALNVFSYAYDGAEGPFTLTFAHDAQHRRIELEFRDGGKAYNPLEREDPDLSVPIAKREIGGLGILMSKQLTDAQAYRRENEQNILTVVKHY